MDEKKGVDKNAELEQILSELNSTMKHTAGSPAEKRTPRRPADRGGKSPRSQDSPRETKRIPAGLGQSELLRSSKILDDGGEPPKSAPVRHIAVTAAEVVDEPRQATAGNLPEAEISIGRAGPPRVRRGPRGRRKPRMTRREKATAVLGFFVSVFVIIGVVSTVVAGVHWTRDLLNSTALKAEFTKLIFPLVIIDAPEFDNPKDLDNSAIISSAIWAFIIDDNDKSKYPKDEFGEMTVPGVDIEPYIRQLFGSDIPIVHQTVEGLSVQMNYNPATKSYLIESTPRFLPYTPRVDKITRDKDIYTLQVSYVVPDAVWNLDKTHASARVDKIYQYRLQKNKTGYQILSVKLQNLVGGDIPSSQPESSLPTDNGLDESAPAVSAEEISSGASSSEGDASEAVSSRAPSSEEGASEAVSSGEAASQ